jgi:hypothetical protein
MQADGQFMMVRFRFIGESDPISCFSGLFDLAV